MRASHSLGRVAGVRQNLGWIGAIVAVLALLEGARRVAGDARSARRSVRLALDGHPHDGGHCGSGPESTKRSIADRGFPGSVSIDDRCPSPGDGGDVPFPDAPWSPKTREVQLAKRLPVLVQGPATVWAVVPANGARGTSTEAVETSFGHAIAWTCTNGDLAQVLHSAKTRWALWQPSNGAHWKHVAVRTRFR